MRVTSANAHRNKPSFVLRHYTNGVTRKQAPQIDFLGFALLWEAKVGIEKIQIVSGA